MCFTVFVATFLVYLFALEDHEHFTADGRGFWSIRSTNRHYTDHYVAHRARRQAEYRASLGAETDDDDDDMLRSSYSYDKLSSRAFDAAAAAWDSISISAFEVPEFLTLLQLQFPQPQGVDAFWVVDDDGNP